MSLNEKISFDDKISSHSTVVATSAEMNITVSVDYQVAMMQRNIHLIINLKLHHSQVYTFFILKSSYN
jgi:hypothetical protein